MQYYHNAERATTQWEAPPGWPAEAKHDAAPAPTPPAATAVHSDDAAIVQAQLSAGAAGGGAGGYGGQAAELVAEDVDGDDGGYSSGALFFYSIFFSFFRVRNCFLAR